MNEIELEPRRRDDRPSEWMVWLITWVAVLVIVGAGAALYWGVR